MTSRILTTGLAALALALGPSGAASQETREELIDEARGQFTDSVALDLLMNAADPGAAPLDSLWAVSVFDLALTLIGQEREPLALVWLRWAARQAPQWTIDRSWFPPSVIDAYDRAVPTVRETGGLGDPSVATTWRWPSEFDRTAPGAIEVRAGDPSVPVTVDVEGEGSVSAGGTLTLEPGTYEMVATAQGFEAARVTREVLPGATTVLEIDLAPQLLPAAEATVEPSLVRIRTSQGGQPVCTNGIVARAGGLVLTSRSGLTQTSGLEVVTSRGVYPGVSVAASDDQLDLAVLRVGEAGLPALQTAGSVSDGQHVWAVFHDGCGDVGTDRTRLESWTPSAPVALASGLPAAALGSALIDRTGALVGVVIGQDRVAPLGSAERLLARAAEDLIAGEPQVTGGGGGGPPWIWIGAGVAAAGVAAVVLGGGGEGGPDPTPTGGIRITFPGGAP
jgi:hypothetical protein